MAAPQEVAELRRKISGLFGSRGGLSRAQHAALLRTHFCFVGWGSVGRPLGEALAEYGALDFTLIDPKSYLPKSVVSQCTADEIGMLKVEAGRRSLAASVARVRTYARDVFTVADGVVRPNSVVIVSADNARAAIGANRMAARMGCMLLKVNVEPEYAVVAVRAYDFRRPSLFCAECQLSDAHYQRQTHPQSCDGTGERPTSSPRVLSQAAGEIGATAALALLDESKATRWLNAETQFFAKTAEAVRSQLAPKPACRWDHQERWWPLERLSCAPHEIRLADLLRSAGVAPGGAAQASFCQRVALRSRCEQCCRELASPRWFTDWESGAGPCPHCKGRLQAVPFFARREVSLEDLAPVLNEPLATWGVASGAVIQVGHAGTRRAFVVGSGGSCLLDHVEPLTAEEPPL
jgi:hypothetical protein